MVRVRTSVLDLGVSRIEECWAGPKLPSKACLPRRRREVRGWVDAESSACTRRRSTWNSRIGGGGPGGTSHIVDVGDAECGRLRSRALLEEKAWLEVLRLLPIRAGSEAGYILRYPVKLARAVNGHSPVTYVLSFTWRMSAFRGRDGDS